jgi:hypothetical protein
MVLKNVKKKLCKSFAINYFFRIIVKGIADFAQVVGYLANQVYIFYYKPSYESNFYKTPME